MAAHPWQGAKAGYLVQHNGPGVRMVDGVDVRPYRPKA